MPLLPSQKHKPVSYYINLLVHSAKSKGLPHSFWIQEWNLSIEKKLALVQNLTALRLQISFLISEFFLLTLFTISAGFVGLTIIIVGKGFYSSIQHSTVFQVYLPFKHEVLAVATIAGTHPQ